MAEIIYKTNLENIDWTEMKTTLRQDAFDNGRSPEQLKTSFENSYAICIAYAEGRMIGTARVLSDGVNCNDMCYMSNHQKIAEFSRIFDDSSLQKCNGCLCSLQLALPASGRSVDSI